MYNKQVHMMYSGGLISHIFRISHGFEEKWLIFVTFLIFLNFKLPKRPGILHQSSSNYNLNLRHSRFVSYNYHILYVFFLCSGPIIKCPPSIMTLNLKFKGKSMFLIQFLASWLTSPRLSADQRFLEIKQL